MNNSQKTSWLTDWKSDRTKFVLYLFPLGGVNGIIGPIKFWCRGKRHFLCACALPHQGSSIHVCVHVSLCVVKQGQDSVSVFGHGAGPVAQGVFWLQLWPSSGKEPSVSESHIPWTNGLAHGLHLLSTSFFVPLVFPWKSRDEWRAWLAAQNIYLHQAFLKTSKNS